MARSVPIPPVWRAGALALGLLAGGLVMATGAMAEETGRRGGWADEVKRSLDPPSPQPAETKAPARKEPERSQAGSPPGSAPTPLMSRPQPQ